MPQFRYVARKSDGQLMDGVLTCNDRSAAIVQVEQLGGVPMKIEAVGGGSTLREERPKGKSKLGVESSSTSASSPQTDVAPVVTLGHTQQYLFTEQLAHLLGAGMTLDEALGILVRRMKHPKLQSLSAGLHRALLDGRSLSQALRDYPRIFSPLYVNLVSAGEASGALPEILRRLVAHLSDIKALRDRVQQALVYPAVLVVAGVGLIVVFMTVMVPKLTTFFKGTGQALPPATQMLVTANHLLVTYWWLGALLCLGMFALFKAFTRSNEGRKAWDFFTWRIPVYSRIIRFRYYAQFARTLGTLIENGVTLLRALELLEEISGNEYIRQRMVAVRAAVVDGATLSVALGEQGIFPELLIDMMAVGEQSGKFGSTMQMIADVYERELDQQVQIVSTLIPPLVMAVIAGVVGLVVYGILSAVFGLTQGLRGGVR
ncbi:MAG TPA: type II secretion system F family protein [Chthoniobacteraceae bacterium]|jgi:type II secretory pathway component PulF